jgi:hypothetical protein
MRTSPAGPGIGRRVGLLLSALGAAFIGLLTLAPNPGQSAYSDITPLLCLVCGPYGGADVLLNILLFVPLGIGLRLAGWSWARSVGVAASLSFGVEFLQYTVVSGRDASLSDLLTNTLGAMFGAGIAPHLSTLLVPDARPARRLVMVGLAAWLVVLAVSAIGMMPWLPAGAIRNDCTKSAGKPDVFTGTVQSVSLNGVALPCDADVPESQRLRIELGQGEAELDVTTQSSNPQSGRILIHVVRVPRGFVLMLAQHRRGAAFSPPIASNHLGFYSPILRLASAFPAERGVPVRVQAGMRDRRLWLSSEYGGQRQAVEVALSPSHGWTAIFPWGIRVGPRFRVVTAVWIGLLLLPVGYWAGFARTPARALGGMIAAAVAGLGVLPAVTGYAAVHWSEWAGAAAGAAVGWALHSFAAYLQSRCGSPSTSAYSSP